MVAYSYYHTTANDLYETQKKVRKAEIYGYLTESIIYASEDDFEAAYKNANSFFFDLREEQKKGNRGILNDQPKEDIDSILDSSAQIIKALQNHNRSSLDRLKVVRSVYVRSLPGD